MHVSSMTGNLSFGSVYPEPRTVWDTWLVFSKYFLDGWMDDEWMDDGWTDDGWIDG